MVEIYGQALEFIICPKIAQGAVLTLEECKRCDKHGGVEQVRPPGQLKSEENPEGLPPTFRTLCRLPRKIVIGEVIITKDDAEAVSGLADAASKIEVPNGSAE